jgi:phosphoribosylamine--glycine ligase
LRVCMPTQYAEGAAWFAQRMAANGHEVDVSIAAEQCKEALGGIINRVDALDEPEAYDLAVFDVCGQGKLADEARLKTPTIGDSSLATRLEEDRIYGLEFMEQCGIKVSPWEQFSNPADAIRYIKRSKKPLVFKPVGEQDDKSTTYVAKSPEDMLRYFDTLFRSGGVSEFVLQEVVTGTEVSTQVYLNPQGYYALNHTLETKKLMNDNLGPATGCSGSLVWMCREDRVFDQGLKKAVAPLQALGYVGPIDLNTIVNDDGVWGLEWTSRFGYDADALLTRLLPMEFGEFLHKVASGEKLPDMSPLHSYCASIRLSCPPYPCEGLPRKHYKAGVPIHGLTEDMLDKFFLYDARKNEEGTLETAGICGWIGSPLAVGETPGQAFESAREMLRQVTVPNGQFRTDVLANTSARLTKLRVDGWLKDAPYER